MYNRILQLISDLYIDTENQKSIRDDILKEVKLLRNRCLNNDTIAISAIADIPNVLSTVSCLDMVSSDSWLVSSFNIEYSSIQEQSSVCIPFTTIPAMMEIPVTDISFQDNTNNQIVRAIIKISINPSIPYTNTIYIENGALFGKIGEEFSFVDKCATTIDYRNTNTCIVFAIKKLIEKFLDVIEFCVCEEDKDAPED